jgi:oligosaccharide repeat unit polymerase
VATGDLLSLLPQLREQGVEQTGGLQFDLVRNAPIVCFVLALVAYLERDGSTWRNARGIMAVALAILYGLATGSKAVLITLPLTLYFISSIRQRQLLVKEGALLFALIVVLFGIGLFLVNLPHLADDDPAEVLVAVLASFSDYTVSSLFAFDQVLGASDHLENHQSITRFFYETANSFGASYYVPSLIAEWANVSPVQITNTYSFYYTYYMDAGWSGIAVLPFFDGLLLGVLFVVALRGNRVAIVMYALLLKGVVLSIHSEQFLLSLNWHIKSLLILLVIYELPMMIARAKRVYRYSVGNASSTV